MIKKNNNDTSACLGNVLTAAPKKVSTALKGCVRVVTATASRVLVLALTTASPAHLASFTFPTWGSACSTALRPTMKANNSSLMSPACFGSFILNRLPILISDVKNGECRSCDEKCATCRKRADFCTSCEDHMVLHNNTCLLTCPPATFKNLHGRYTSFLYLRYPLLYKKVY